MSSKNNIGDLGSLIIVLIIIVLVVIVVIYMKNNYEKRYKRTMASILEKHRDLFASIENTSFESSKRWKSFEKLSKVNSIMAEEYDFETGMKKSIYDELSKKYRKIFFEYIFSVFKFDIMEYISFNKREDLLEKLKKIEDLYYGTMLGSNSTKNILNSVREIAKAHKLIIYISHQIGYAIDEKYPNLKTEAYDLYKNEGSCGDLVSKCLNYKPATSTVHGVSVNWNNNNNQGPTYSTHHSVHEHSHPFNNGDIKSISNDIEKIASKYFKTMSNIYSNMQ